MSIALIIVGTMVCIAFGTDIFGLNYTGEKIFDTITSIAGIVTLLAIGWVYIGNTTTSLHTLKTSEEKLMRERIDFEERIALRTQKMLAVEHERNRELERIAEFGTLSQGLFHDMMSPLSSLSLYLERLSPSEQTEETQKILFRITDISRRMNSFMDSIHRFSISHDQHITTANLHTELSTITDVLGFKARMNGVRIHIPVYTRVILRTHPVHIQQIFMNLISNAIEACKKVHDKTSAEQTISISYECTSTGCTIRVTDTGCGMPESSLHHIWDRGYSTKHGSNGIGLATVRDIVEMKLGGTIAVESTEGVGSTFTVVVPKERIVNE